GQDGAQPGQGRGVGVLGRAAVADHEAGPDPVTVVVRAGSAGLVVAQAVNGHPVLAGSGKGGMLQARLGQVEDRVHARGDPGDPQALTAQGDGQPVPAAPIGEPGPADLPVVGARGDELGQGQLVERGRPGGQLRRYRVDQPRRDDQPAEPQAGGQALAGRPGVDDVVGRERLQRAYRLAVVAEL